MINQEIDQNEWSVFLDDFSRRHLGRPVTVEVLDRLQGSQTVASGLPLVGVVADTKSSEGEVVEIIAGESGRQNVVHAIPHPSHIRLAKTDQGQDAAVEFESADEPKTLLRFDPPQTTTAMTT